VSQIANSAIAATGVFAPAGRDEDTGASNSARGLPSVRRPADLTVFDGTRGGRADGAVRVVGTGFLQVNSAVYMRVGRNRGPWRCLVSDHGSNPSIMFMGTEGAS